MKFKISQTLLVCCIGIFSSAKAQDQHINGNVYAGAVGSYWGGFRSNAASGTWGFQQSDRAMIGLGGNVYNRGFSNYALGLFNGSTTKEDIYLYNKNASDGDFLVLKNTGNVGINIVNPLYQIDVGGSGRFSNGTSATASILNHGGGAFALVAGGDLGTYGAPAGKYPLRLYEGLGWNFTLQNIFDPNGFSSGFRVRSFNESILFNVRSDGRIGLGTDMPAELLELKSDQPVVVYHKPGVASYKMGIDNSGVFRIAGMDNSYGGHGGNFLANSDQVMVIDKDGNVGIGLLAPTERLAVKGKIRAKEIKVEATNWPDYVFQEGYEVGTLEALERYIKTYKHLPEIPAAKEVESHGVALGEMNKLLLKKIEELTLYLIELKKENEFIKKEIKTIKDK